MSRLNRIHFLVFGPNKELAVWYFRKEAPESRIAEAYNNIKIELAMLFNIKRSQIKMYYVKTEETIDIHQIVTTEDHPLGYMLLSRESIHNETGSTFCYKILDSSSRPVCVKGSVYGLPVEAMDVLRGGVGIHEIHSMNLIQHGGETKLLVQFSGTAGKAILVRKPGNSAPFTIPSVYTLVLESRDAPSVEDVLRIKKLGKPWIITPTSGYKRTEKTEFFNYSDLIKSVESIIRKEKAKTDISLSVQEDETWLWSCRDINGIVYYWILLMDDHLQLLSESADTVLLSF